MRLQSFLAQSGIESRRHVIQVLEEGRVKVNDEVVRISSYPIFPDKDHVSVDGCEVKLSRKKMVYFMFHKPAGVITTARDTHGRKTVLDFFKDVPERLYPVGRLDQDTTGLLLVTNDGVMTNRLTHPRFGVQKIYEAVLDKEVSEAEAKQLAEGVVIEGRKTAPCQIKILGLEEGKCRVEISLHEGQKRQIRLMFEGIGRRVVLLHRKQYGPLTLEGLKPGERRPLLDSEIRLLGEGARREPVRGEQFSPRPFGSGRRRGGRGRFHSRTGSGQNRPANPPPQPGTSPPQSLPERQP